MTPCCNTLGKTVETANLVGKTERLKIASSKTLVFTTNFQTPTLSYNLILVSDKQRYLEKLFYPNGLAVRRYI